MFGLCQRQQHVKKQSKLSRVMTLLIIGLCQRQQHVKKHSTLSRVMYTTYIWIMLKTAKCSVTKYKVQSTENLLKPLKFL